MTPVEMIMFIVLMGVVVFSAVYVYCLFGDKQ